MDVQVMDQSFKIQGICDDYKSIIWTPRYFTAGDFELYLPATDKNISLLKEDFYVVRDKDVSKSGSSLIFKNVMIIEKVQVTTDVENGNYLIVTGRCLKSLLMRRIVWRQTTLSGKLEVALRKIVTDNAISPTIAARKMPGLQLGQLKNFTETLDKQVTGATLYDFISEVCTTYGIGWEIYIKDKNFLFELYKGEDRSYNQSKNPHVTFSQEFDNLLTTDYQYDKSNYKNVALVAGEGEGLDRKTVSVGDSTGLTRYELYVDSRNSSTNDGEITEAEYNKILAEEGLETLNGEDYTITENIEGQIETSGNYQFGKDYFLGDIVEVINEYGIETTPRIIEVIESEDDSGTSTIPTFSTMQIIQTSSGSNGDDGDGDIELF